MYVYIHKNKGDYNKNIQVIIIELHERLTITKPIFTYVSVYLLVIVWWQQDICGVGDKWNSALQTEAQESVALNNDTVYLNCQTPILYR